MIGCKSPRVREGSYIRSIDSGAAAGELFRRLLGDAQVGLERPEALREKLLRLLVADGGRDDYVLALLPVDGRRDFVLIGELQRIDDAQNLLEVAARTRRLRDDERNLLIRVGHGDGAPRRGRIGVGLYESGERRARPVGVGDGRDVER